MLRDHSKEIFKTKHRAGDVGWYSTCQALPGPRSDPQFQDESKIIPPKTRKLEKKQKK